MKKSNLKRELLKEYFSFSFGVWVSAFISFFSVIILTRLIAPKEYGKATTFQMLISLLFPICNLETSNGMMRFYYSREKEDRAKLIWGGIWLSLMSWTLVSILILAFSNKINIFVSGENGLFAPIFLVLHLLISIFQSFNQNIIRAERKGRLYSLVNISKTAGGFLVPLFLILLFHTKSYEIIVFGSVASVLTALIIGFRVGYSYWLRPKLDLREMKMLFTYSFPLVFEFVASYIMVFTDRFMLRLLTNFNEIGMYSAAYKLISISGILTSGFLYFWRPYALSLFNEDPERTRNVTRKMFDTVTAGIVLFALSVIAIRDVVTILLGSEYREAKYIFPFLLFAPIYDLSKAVLIRGVEFSKKSKWAAVPNSIGAFVNVIGNWLLIPILGARGAAISTALSMLVVIIFLSFISNKLYPVQYNFLKVYTAYFVYIFAAAFGTFVEYSYSLIISIISIIVILLLFKKQVTEIISELSEYVRELFLRFHS